MPPMIKDEQILEARCSDGSLDVNKMKVLCNKYHFSVGSFIARNPTLLDEIIVPGQDIVNLIFRVRIFCSALLSALYTGREFHLEEQQTLGYTGLAAPKKRKIETITSCGLQAAMMNTRMSFRPTRPILPRFNQPQPPTAEVTFLSSLYQESCVEVAKLKSHIDRLASELAEKKRMKEDLKNMSKNIMTLMNEQREVRTQVKRLVTRMMEVDIKENAEENETEGTDANEVLDGGEEDANDDSPIDESCLEEEE